MKFTDEFKTAADKFFNALKKLDANGSVLVENSATVVEAPKAEPEAVTADVTAEVATDVATQEAKAEDAKAEDTKAEVTAEVPANTEVEDLKKKVAELTAELANVKVSLNSTIDGNTELVEKLSVIMNAPRKGDLVEVQNSRPTETKEDFKGWDAAINAKLNIKK